MFNAICVNQRRHRRVSTALARLIGTSWGASETAARTGGWTVQRKRFGTRVYRDSRFDQPAECRDCAGTGVVATAQRAWACDRVPCVRCLGTGVIRSLTVGRCS